MVTVRPCHSDVEVVPPAQPLRRLLQRHVREDEASPGPRDLVRHTSAAQNPDCASARQRRHLASAEQRAGQRDSAFHHRDALALRVAVRVDAEPGPDVPDRAARGVHDKRASGIMDDAEVRLAFQVHVPLAGREGDRRPQPAVRVEGDFRAVEQPEDGAPPPRGRVLPHRRRLADRSCLASEPPRPAGADQGGDDPCGDRDLPPA